MKQARKAQDDLSVSFPEVAFQRQALVLKGISFKRWVELGKVLSEIEDAMQFWIGDYLNAGENAFGEKYSQAVDEKQADRWTHYAWVARSVKSVYRKHNLSYKHHEAVAPLQPKDQVKWLDKAEKNKWKVHKLREQIRLFREPQRKVDFQEPLDPPPISIETEESEGHEEDAEQIIITSTARSNLEFEFKQLVDLCRALILAEKGNLAQGIKPNAEDRVRLFTALQVFIGSHDRHEEQVWNIGGRKKREKQCLIE
jgi:hypothetical protein